MIAVEHQRDSVQQGLIRLFEERSAGVHGLVLARCGDPSLAEEITAQTFESAARQFARGKGDDVTTGWLTTVALRRLVDHWRRSGRQRRLVERMTLSSAGVADEFLPRDHDIEEALGSLPTSQRSVVVLRYLDDWSVSEIAEGLDLTYRAVESLLARARRSLRAALEERS